MQSGHAVCLCRANFRIVRHAPAIYLSPIVAPQPLNSATRHKRTRVYLAALSVAPFTAVSSKRRRPIVPTIFFHSLSLSTRKKYARRKKYDVKSGDRSIVRTYVRLELMQLIMNINSRNNVDRTSNVHNQMATHDR